MNKTELEDKCKQLGAEVTGLQRWKKIDDEKIERLETDLKISENVKAMHTSDLRAARVLIDELKGKCDRMAKKDRRLQSAITFLAVNLDEFKGGGSI